MEKDVSSKNTIILKRFNDYSGPRHTKRCSAVDFVGLIKILCYIDEICTYVIKEGFLPVCGVCVIPMSL